jgi:mannonate dehydratase
MEGGGADDEHSAIYVPNAYAREIARSCPMEFDWVASIHPYRDDAIDELARVIHDGAKAIKWLPPAMGIDPASPRCDAFYAALARADLPLITHAGEERAVAGTARGELGNPLRLRRALDAGVRVVVAHCATMGSDRDLDRGAHGPELESFALFARLMGERRYEGRLFGDLSALPQANRAAYLGPLMERSDWHGRLLNGSDYPLPGLMPAYSMDVLVSRGLLEPAAAPVLSEIRRHNPLLFDLVLKRHLRWRGRAFPQVVFHTRRFFERAHRNA